MCLLHVLGNLNILFIHLKGMLSPVVDATAFVLINSVKERLVHRELLRLSFISCAGSDAVPVGLSPYSVGNLADRRERWHAKGALKFKGQSGIISF